MFGGVGSTWGDNLFLHGYAEWVETRDLTLGNFDSRTLELKLRPFAVLPYVCIGSHAFAMFSAHTNVTTITHFDQH